MAKKKDSRSSPAKQSPAAPAKEAPAKEAESKEPRSTEGPGAGGAVSEDESRRGFLNASCHVAMAGGLAAAYGTFGYTAARYLYPDEGEAARWQFVAVANQIAVGDALPFTAPSGAKIVIARQAEAEDERSFVALSNICPHLGCQVHWEPQNERFFCPCHNGAFDRQGRATEGPPAQAKQTLKQFALKIEAGLLYILAPTQALV